MSKIGKMPIDIGSTEVEVKGQEVFFKGKNAQGSYRLPDFLQPKLDGKKLTLEIDKFTQQKKKDWGLHRALLANKITGASKLFEKGIQINGLGYKAILSGDKITFALGFSHKINFDLPKGVFLQLDKTGQNLVFSSADKDLLGHVCASVRSLRPPEPYKGTGVKLVSEKIFRKAGKTKST